MTIEIKEKLTGSILDIGGGGEAVIGQIYKDRVTAIDNCKEELEEAPDCCSKQLMDATELSFPDDSFDNVTFFYTLMYMTAEEQSSDSVVRLLESAGLKIESLQAKDGQFHIQCRKD